VTIYKGMIEHFKIKKLKFHQEELTKLQL